MGKKKSNVVVYTPTSASIPPISENIPEIPQYDDAGVSYKRYAKIPTGNGRYNLKNQDTRFYLGALFPGNHNITGSRTDWTKYSFFSSLFIFSYRTTSDMFINIYDGNTNNPRLQIPLFANTNGHFTLNFDNCRRQFSEQYIIFELVDFSGADYILGANELVAVHLMGWDEEK